MNKAESGTDGYSDATIGVSVVCTAYNHERYIRQCLDGFVMQETTFPFEVLINDDASTDGTATIIREYEECYPDIIRAFYQEENLYSRGLSATSYCLVPNARGKYIAFCEGDDFWTDSHKLQLQYEAMEAHPECSICGHYVDFVSEDGLCSEGLHPKRPLKEGTINSSDQVYMALYDNIQTSCTFLRTDFQKDYLRDTPDYVACSGKVGIGDIPKYLYCASMGDMYFIPQKMSCYRMASIGSWTCRVAEGDAKTRESLWCHQSNMVELFNKETNGVYCDICLPRMTEWRFRSLIYGQHYREMMKPEYKAQRKSMGASERTIVYVGAYAPWLLRLYRKLMRKDY